MLLGQMPTGLFCKGVDGSDEVVMSSVTDAVENFVWHECVTPKIVCEQFAEELISHLPSPFIKPFPKHSVVLGGFVRFHS